MRQKGMVLVYFLIFFLPFLPFPLSPFPLFFYYSSSLQTRFQHDFNTISGECESLRTCFLTTLNQGIRAGGGIGEYMRPSDPFGGNSIQGGDVKQDTYRYWLFRLMFDLGYFLMLNIVLLNLVFGIIIDTFAGKKF